MSQDNQTGHSLSRRRLGLVLAAALARPNGTAAAPADLAGWGATRWGMSSKELAPILGPARIRLAKPLEYGALIVRDTLPGQRIAGRPFVAVFQLDRASERLAQVMLRYRGDFPMMNDFAAVRDALAKDLGAPHARRAATNYSGSFPSFWIEAGWKFPTIEVGVSLVDQNADPYSAQRKTLLVRYSPAKAQR